MPRCLAFAYHGISWCLSIKEIHKTASCIIYLFCCWTTFKIMVLWGKGKGIIDLKVCNKINMSPVKSNFKFLSILMRLSLTFTHNHSHLYTLCMYRPLCMSRSGCDFVNCSFGFPGVWPAGNELFSPFGPTCPPFGVTLHPLPCPQGWISSIKKANRLLTPASILLRVQTRRWTRASSA